MRAARSEAILTGGMGTLLALPSMDRSAQPMLHRRLLAFGESVLFHTLGAKVTTATWSYSHSPPAGRIFDLRSITLFGGVYGGDSAVPPGMVHTQLLRDRLRVEMYLPLHVSAGRDVEKLVEDVELTDLVSDHYASLLKLVNQWPHCLGTWDWTKSTLAWSRGWLFTRPAPRQVFLAEDAPLLDDAVMHTLAATFAWEWKSALVQVLV